MSSAVEYRIFQRANLQTSENQKIAAHCQIASSVCGPQVFKDLKSSSARRFVVPVVTGTFQDQAAFVPAHETTFTHKIQAPYSDYITEHTFCTQDLG
jgi:hypothetical protein